MESHNNPAAKLTVPAHEGKKDETQANTAVTTDGFKNSGDSATQGATATTTGDETKAAEGDKKTKKTAKAEGGEAGETIEAASSGEKKW